MPRKQPPAAGSSAVSPGRGKDDSALVAAVVGWFRRSARDLPWRTAPRHPWRSLVSEFMLQQTQVARVLEKFEPFMRRFPTPAALARADEADVLAAWAGLGYYRRAKLLHAAAKALTAEFSGVVPATVEELTSLPGVGRYTAGAVASIVFGQLAPIVDGNVSRVLLRVHGRPQTAAESVDWAWGRAEELVREASKGRSGRRTGSSTIAAFNEGLMELGATVCTPRSPACDRCPLAKGCTARRDGTQGTIPTPKKPGRRKFVLCEVVVVRDGKGRVLLERRPDTGMWAGMWQAPTLEREVDEPPERSLDAKDEGRGKAVAGALGLKGLQFASMRPRAFVHQTSHREVHFRVWEAIRMGGGSSSPGVRTWVPSGEMERLGVSNAQKRALGVESRRGDADR